MACFLRVSYNINNYRDLHSYWHNFIFLKENLLNNVTLYYMELNAGVGVLMHV